MISLFNCPALLISHRRRSPAAAATRAPPAEPTFYQDLSKPDTALDPAAAASMISGYRSNNGLGPVTRRSRADADGGRTGARHGRSRQDGSRYRPPVPGPDPQFAVFRNSVAVENISAGYHTFAEAFSGWRDSPPHRANMLNRSVTRIGIAAALAPNSKYKVFWALILAGPGPRG